MNGLRIFLLIPVAAALLVLSSGCAANRPGSITLSHPKVWHENAIVATTGYQLKKIEEFGKNVDLGAIQGRRARRYLQALILSGIFDVTVPSPAAPSQEDTGGGDAQSAAQSRAAESFPDRKQSVALTLDDLSKFFEDVKVKEDPIDGLQRVDDFYQVLGGLRLTHLRDTSSMSKGWSLYLLGFDISLVPEDKTSQDHGAYVELQVEVCPKHPKKQVYPKDPKKDEDVRIYSVWPQRYADRFEEALSLREDLHLTLRMTATLQGTPATVAQDLAQRYEEDLALIQRYPLISGFIKGPHRFGWVFNPRLRIVTKRYPLFPDCLEHRYWLESGVRHCYALLAVRDDRIEVPKRVAKLNEEDLNEIAKFGRTTFLDFNKVTKAYRELIGQLPDSQEKDRLEEMLKTVEESMKETAPSKEEREELEKRRFKELKAYHRKILCLGGRQGKDGIKELKLTAECHWFNRRNGKVVKADDKFFDIEDFRIVKLPDKIDRTLEGIWAVWPERGLFNKWTTVTIKGQNFSNDARVFVGGKEAPPEKVSVVGRDFIVASFPPFDEVLAEGETKTVRVKVITGGDSMTAEEAFSYYRPSNSTTRGAKPDPDKQQKTGGRAG